jgi:uncharacterized RDD family membrane protein YckC
MENNMAAGYLSEHNKRKFTIAAGIIGGAFFFAQFIVPLIVMMAAMPAMMFSGDFQFKNAHPERGAYWDNTIWYIETIQTFQPAAQPQITLNTLPDDTETDSNVVADIPFEDTWLLADDDILWIISSSGVAYYSDGDIEIIDDSQKIGNISRPFIFNKTSQHQTEISGMVLENHHWKPFFSYKQSFPGDMGIFFIEAPNYFYMLLQGMPGSLRLLEFEGSKLLGKYRYGSGFPFPKSMIGIMVIPQLGMLLLPLILAFILSGLMLKHRITVHAAESLHMKYASLTRRALAQLVDMAVVLGPSIIIGLYFLSSFWDMEDFFISGPTSMAGFFGMFAFSFLWVVICFFAFSILEGKLGRTPGKWVTGIRVLGMDLHPCGIGRGLLRNLLKVVDGFFNFMVGIMVVALSENWQRVGDMASRTVVVRADTKMQPNAPPRINPS